MEPPKHPMCKFPSLKELIEGGMVTVQDLVSYRTWPTYEGRIASCCEELKALCDAYCLPRGC